MFNVCNKNFLTKSHKTKFYQSKKSEQVCCFRPFITPKKKRIPIFSKKNNIIPLIHKIIIKLS